MPVVFDANFLMPLLDAEIRIDKVVRQKLGYLVAQLQKDSEKIVVPTPALAELLIGAGDATPAYLNIISRSRFFRIVPFDMRAAIEVAASHREALRLGDKREGTDQPWQKIKYDRQILAIAKVEGATRIYTNDQGLRTLAEADGLTVLGFTDLDAPPEEGQTDLFRTFDDDEDEV